MNTGIQVSSATPAYAWTGTTRRANPRRKKNIMEIMAAHYNPYSATATIGFRVTSSRRSPSRVSGTKFFHMPRPLSDGLEDGVRPIGRTVHPRRGDECLPALRGGRREENIRSTMSRAASPSTST